MSEAGEEGSGRSEGGGQKTSRETIMEAIPVEDVENYIRNGRLIEVGRHACWAVSTAKAGLGIDCLRDNDPRTYWQSDGKQPHCITISFSRRTELEEVLMLLNFEEDESYTPQKVSVRTGFRADEMEEVNVIHFSQPQGWVRFPVVGGDQVGTTAKVFVLELAITANHQSGRDTHVRQLKVLASPRESEIDGWEDQGVR